MKYFNSLLIMTKSTLVLLTEYFWQEKCHYKLQNHNKIEVSVIYQKTYKGNFTLIFMLPFFEQFVHFTILIAMR